MKRYEAYKDSSASWISEIPSTWREKRVSYTFEKIGSGTTPSTDIGKYYDDGDINWINTGDLNDGVLTKTAKKLTEAALNDHSVLKIYPPQSIVIAMYGATIGKTSITNIEACTNQACCTLYGSSDVIEKFAFYWFLSNKQYLISLGSGGGQPNISQGTIRNLKIQIPPKNEQVSIVQYLDNKIGQIDQIIQQKELLLEKLQAKRHAIINEAVTKGVNHDSPMKQSGIEWLGDIPEHWQAKKLKYISPSISVGLVINPSSYYSDNGEVPMITGKHIQPFKIDAGTAKKITKSSNDELWRSQIHYQDIVVVRVGYPGIAAVVPKEADGFNCASMMIVRKGDFNSDFLCYCFNSTIGKEQVSLVEYGAAQRQFNLSHAVNFIFPFPPIKEQKEIVMWLQNKFQEFDVLNSKLIVQIEKLKLYRQSLISEVVTGKIKVV